MSTLLSSDFWFNLRPGSLGSTPRNIFIGLILVLIIFAVLLFIAKKKKGSFKNLFASLYNFCISNAFIGLLILFFNYELIPFFSAHFWFLLWLIIAIWWLFSILKKLKRISNQKKQKIEVDEIKKYLP